MSDETKPAPKPGYKTTEFWGLIGAGAAILGQPGPVADAFGGMSENVQIASVAGLCVVLAVYIHSRGAAKKG